MATQSFIFGQQLGEGAPGLTVGPATTKPPATVSPAELATGMQLVRAACLQATRLQLAMLRRDPQPTLESLDNLAAIDREIEEFVNSIVPPATSADAPQHDLDRLIALQKVSLATEKMALMSGGTGPLFRENEPHGADRSEADFRALDMAATPAEEGAPVPSLMEIPHSEYQSSGKLGKFMVFATILLAVAAAIGWFVMQGNIAG